MSIFFEIIKENTVRSVTRSGNCRSSAPCLIYVFCFSPEILLIQAGRWVKVCNVCCLLRILLPLWFYTFSCDFKAMIVQSSQGLLCSVFQPQSSNGSTQDLHLLLRPYRIEPLLTMVGIRGLVGLQPRWRRSTLWNLYQISERCFVIMDILGLLARNFKFTSSFLIVKRLHHQLELQISHKPRPC